MSDGFRKGMSVGNVHFLVPCGRLKSGTWWGRYLPSCLFGAADGRGKAFLPLPLKPPLCVHACPLPWFSFPEPCQESDHHASRDYPTILYENHCLEGLKGVTSKSEGWLTALHYYSWHSLSRMPVRGRLRPACITIIGRSYLKN